MIVIAARQAVDAAASSTWNDPVTERRKAFVDRVSCSIVAYRCGGRDSEF